MIGSVNFIWWCYYICVIIGEGVLYGVDINIGGIVDLFVNFVWELVVVKVL